MDKPNCERWMWIELIGFDNTQPDYNVQAFLDNAGFIPEGLSLFVYSPDFLHTHESLEQEMTLPPDYCSYAARPYNLDRERQAWTNWQLKGLVEELQKRGIEVYFCIFNVYISELDGELYRSPWSDAHPELMETLRDGTSANCLNPLRRFPDGSYYEDFHVAQLRKVVQDYGFDGYHGGDGFSSPRHPIWMADYSDDMVEQFAAMMKVEVPQPGSAGVSPADSQARAEYIWNNLRHEWCEFYARRFEQFWGKVCAALHAMDRHVFVNNAWTRDPFEAFYRYGIDYRRMARAGIERFMVETVGAGVSIGAEAGFRADLRHELNFMPAFIKACLPQMPLLCLNATGDTTENWDVLNHAPAVSEREIYTLGHMFLLTQAERPSSSRPAPLFLHASDGPLVCLADGITCEQWKWERENWQTAYERIPSRVLGATVVWSEAALDAEFDDYVAHRNATRQQVAGELQKRGAPLQVVVNIRDLAAATGALLVPRPELLPPDELDLIRAYDRGPVIFVGRREGLPAPVLFADGPDPDHLACAVLGSDSFDVSGLAVNLPQRPAPPLPLDMPDPPNYLQYLYTRTTSEGFWQACTDLLIEVTQPPVPLSKRAELRVLAFESDPQTIRLLVGNESDLYVLDRLDMRREVASVHIAGHFPGKPIYPDGQYIDVRVPPRGMIALDVMLK